MKKETCIDCKWLYLNNHCEIKEDDISNLWPDETENSEEICYHYDDEY